MLTRLERPWNGFKSSSHKTGKTIRSFLLTTELFQCKTTRSADFTSHSYDLSKYSALYCLLFQLAHVYLDTCRISCTSSDIYNIGILNVPVMPPIPMRVLLSISLWFERSSPFPHDSLGECYGMDMWWWICESWEGSAASHPDAAQQKYMQLRSLT